MLVDFTLRADQIVSTVALLGAGFFYAGGLKGEVRQITKAQEKAETRLDAMERALTAIATQEVRLADHERRIGKLED